MDRAQLREALSVFYEQVNVATRLMWKISHTLERTNPELGDEVSGDIIKLASHFLDIIMIAGGMLIRLQESDDVPV